MSVREDAHRVAAALERVRRDTAKNAPGLAVTEARVLLALLHSFPASHAKMTAALGSEKAHISRAVTTLVNKGLVSSAASLTHKLQKDLYLTASGRELAEDIQRGRAGDMMCAFIEALGTDGPHHLQALAQALPPATERLQPTARSIVVREARDTDLAWLLERLGRRARGPFGGSYFAHRVQDLHEHLQYAADRPYRWMVESWGERVGGCVLTPDVAAMENAWIKLLYEEHDSKDASRELLRRCVAVAGEETYELVRLMSPQEDARMREVLNELGFRPIEVAEPFELGTRTTAITWELRLRPPLRF